MADEVPWRWFVALDGGELDGLLGSAGLLRFDWPSRAIKYRFYDGISAGHNVTLSPDGKRLLLGNFSQQILIIDTNTLDEIARHTTMGVEESDYRLRSNTHHLWYDDTTFLAAVGEHLYKFHLADLGHPEKLGAHHLRNVHEIRWTSGEHRYVLMGDLGPEDSGARQVGIFDLLRRESTIVRLPATVWHVAVHPDRNIGYAATYSIAAQDDDFVDWGPAYTREYIVEIDLANAVITRSWSSSAAFPIHLNSDLEIYVGDGVEKLYVAAGGSHTVVELDLHDFATTRVMAVEPSWWRRPFPLRQWWRDVWGALLRKSIFTNSHLFLQAYVVTGRRFFDGVYCNRVSPDGRFLVAGNRGHNYIRVMDRATLATVSETFLPHLPNGLHLGMHHSELRGLDKMRVS